MERLTGISILLFALATNLIGYIGVAYIVFPSDPTMLAGVLAFIGAIIGGFITYIGVKLSLEHVNNEKVLANVSAKIFLLEDCLKALQSPLNTIFLIQVSNVPEQFKTEEYNKQIVLFNNAFDKYYRKLRVKLDFGFIHLLSFHYKSISLTKYKIESGKLTSAETVAGIEKVREIVGSLDKEKKKLINQYYEINKRQKDILK